MGKIDDMRRQREALHARGERARAGQPAATDDAPAAEEAPPVVETEPTVRVGAPSLPRRKQATDEEGVCSVCGKLRPLQGGMIASHQKGLGKFCPGSRKPPA